MSQTGGYSSDIDALRTRQKEIGLLLREKGVNPEARGPIAVVDLIPKGDYLWMCLCLGALIANSYEAAAAAIAAGDTALANSYYQYARMLLEAYVMQCVGTAAI